jgi:HK97 gp10 family phage protein
MPYTLKVEGMEQITGMLKQAGEAAEGIAAQALYKGAGIVADEISREARGVTTKPFRYANGWQREPSPEEKAAIVAAGAAGIAKFQKTGNEVNTSVGYSRSGYVTINGKKKAVAVIANSINSGTSFMKKQPFIRKAVSRSKSKASQAIEEEIERLTGEILK